jgi:hypothetical protein
VKSRTRIQTGQKDGYTVLQVPSLDEYELIVLE